MFDTIQTSEHIYAVPFILSFYGKLSVEDGQILISFAGYITPYLME